ncbi:MAG TPA: type II toxin-antitoxin system RelE/ParE family toxin [Bacteroidia bacterium]|nr:type II toxin-antitoxin system RelE/ParE family toxin [Bacteroidia bacterium]
MVEVIGQFNLSKTSKTLLIAKDSENYAQIQIPDFFEAARTLEEFPKAGRIVPELNDKNIREIIVGLYRILYRVLTKERIENLTVYHSYRLLKKRTIKRKKNRKRPITFSRVYNP